MFRSWQRIRIEEGRGEILWVSETMGVIAEKVGSGRKEMVHGPWTWRYMHRSRRTYFYILSDSLIALKL
jgi:hypothetical protein